MQEHLPRSAVAGLRRRLSVARRTRLRQYNRADAGATKQKLHGLNIVGSAEACTCIIAGQPIITPASIAADGDVELIHSNF